MASNAEKVGMLQTEIKDLESVKNGITSVKRIVHIGNNMTPEGYNILTLVNQWIEKEIGKMKEERDNLSNIHLI